MPFKGLYFPVCAFVTFCKNGDQTCLYLTLQTHHVPLFVSPNGEMEVFFESLDLEEKGWGEVGGFLLRE